MAVMVKQDRLLGLGLAVMVKQDCLLVLILV